MSFYYKKDGRLRKIGVNFFLELAINYNNNINEIEYNYKKKELKVNRIVINNFFENILVSENRMIIKL